MSLVITFPAVSYEFRATGANRSSRPTDADFQQRQQDGGCVCAHCVVVHTLCSLFTLCTLSALCARTLRACHCSSPRFSPPLTVSVGGSFTLQAESTGGGGGVGGVDKEGFADNWHECVQLLHEWLTCPKKVDKFFEISWTTRRLINHILELCPTKVFLLCKQFLDSLRSIWFTKYSR